MNCMSKHVIKQKERMVYERDKAEHKKFLASLSEEELAVYYKEQEERHRHIMQLLANVATISTIFLENNTQE